ncbi:MAG: hypothetical protein ACRCW0_01895 [Clostridium sp.]
MAFGSVNVGNNGLNFKIVQNRLCELSSSQAEASFIINPIDLEKSFVVVTASSIGSQNPSIMSVRSELLIEDNQYKIKFTRFLPGATIVLRYQIYEVENAKSLQTANFSIEDGSQLGNSAIQNVDQNKCLVFYTYASNGSDSSNFTIDTYLSTNNSIEARRGASEGRILITAYILEVE